MLNLKVGDFVKSSKDNRIGEVIQLKLQYQNFPQKYRLLIVHDSSWLNGVKPYKPQFVNISDDNTIWSKFEK